MAFHTVKDRYRELLLELLQSNVFGVTAKVLARVTVKEKCRAVTQTCNTCGQKGHFSGARDLSLLHVQAAASGQNLEGVIKSRYSQCFKRLVSLRVAILRFMLIHSVNQLHSQLDGSIFVTRTRSLSCLSAR